VAEYTSFAAVGPEFFDVFAVRPAIGREFSAEERKTASAVLIGYAYWQSHFGGRPEVLGQTVRMAEMNLTIVGVMPAGFSFPDKTDIWVTVNSFFPETPSRSAHNYRVVGRLKPGAALEQAQAEMAGIGSRLEHAYPDSNRDKNVAVLRMRDSMVSNVKTMLYVLLGAVGLVLLIACANVANLQLARATARAHEISVRMAVGAGRGRLLRQLLTESMVLSTAGGVLGVLLAIAITKAVVLLMPDFYVPNEARITVNSYVLLFSAGISVLTGVLFGLAPALKSSRPDLVDALKDAGRTSGSGAGGRTRSALVVAEIALSVVLLMGASLTIRGFLQLQSVNPGFQPDRVLMMELNASPKRYTTYAQRIAFAENVVAAVSTIPGVQSVALGNGGLPFGGPHSTYSIEGQPKEDSRELLLGLVSSGYSQTLGIPLRAGRDLSPQEIARAEPVALINEAAAKLWPAGASAIGARVHLDILEKLPPDVLTAASLTPVVTVVGIVGDTRNDGLRKPTAPALYFPYTLVAPSDRSLALRTRTQPMLLLNAVRERIRGIDKDQPLGRPITLQEVLGYETVQPRFSMALFSFFGFLGLALAAIGIYSTLSYTVARRTHEIGIRMALGAGRGDVLHLMLRMAGRLVLIGLAIGLGASLALARFLRSEVFQVPGTDPAALAGVVLLLTLAALLACFVPARRAAKLDPMLALRHE
jgi:predicted permease